MRGARRSGSRTYSSGCSLTERVEMLEMLRSSRARHRAILEHSHDLTLLFEADGTIAWMSPNCIELFGIEADAYVGQNGMQMIDARDRERIGAEFLGMANSGDSVRARFRISHSGGGPRWVEEIATNLLDDPDVGYIVGNLRDITDEHLASSALARSEARLRSMLDTAQEGIWVTGGHRRTVFVNPHMAAMLGVDLEALADASLLDFVDPEDRTVVMANDAMSERGEVRRYETRFLRADGAPRCAIVSSAPLTDEGDAEGGGEAPVDILHMVTDITDRKRDEAELRHLALHDWLTGLPNQRLLTNRLAHHLDHGGRGQTSVTFLNVDNFKDINASLGHGAGDAILCEIAQRLRAAARNQDTVARSGSDEFLILSADVAGADEAVAIVERMRRALSAPFRIDGTELVLAASAGVALSSAARRADADGLIRCAGIAMYQAKENGRDGIVVFDQQDDADAQGRMRIHADLRRAITNREFEVWYQPIVGLDDAAVRGVEALVRWRHPTRGLLLPRAFMDVAESTGLIRDIGHDVLETACRDAAAWMDSDHLIRVTVNIAATQVADERLAAQVGAVLASSGLDPELLTLEITETAAMVDREIAERNLQDIRALGVRLALDDFGTGYSSLSLLRRLPVTVVKIDQSFVAGLGERREDELIVAGVISMAQALGHTVIAEGIETTRQRDALRRLGCRYGQGFLWSGAVPVAALASTIATIEVARDEYRRSWQVRPNLRSAPDRQFEGARTGAELGEAAFDAFPAAAAVLDRAGVIVSTNRAWRLFATMNGGSSKSTGVGVDYLGVCDRSTGDGIDGMAVANGLRKVLAGERQQFQIEYECPSPLQDQTFLMHAVPNGVTGLVVIHTDVSSSTAPVRPSRDEAGSRLTTGRESTLLEACFNRMHDDARQHQHPLAVLRCDLVGMNDVADGLGEPTRRQLLDQIGARIARVVRDDDLVARPSDHQFLIACANLDTPELDAARIARRVEEVVAEPFQIGARSVLVHASVAYVTDDGRRCAADVLSDAGYRRLDPRPLGVFGAN